MNQNLRWQPAARRQVSPVLWTRANEWHSHTSTCLSGRENRLYQSHERPHPPQYCTLTSYRTTDSVPQLFLFPPIRLESAHAMLRSGQQRKLDEQIF